MGTASRRGWRETVIYSEYHRRRMRLHWKRCHWRGRRSIYRRRRRAHPPYLWGGYMDIRVFRGRGRWRHTMVYWGHWIGRRRPMRGHMTFRYRWRLSTRDWGRTWSPRCGGLKHQSVLFCVADPVGNTVLGLDVALVGLGGEIVLGHGSPGRKESGERWNEGWDI